MVFSGVFIIGMTLHRRQLENREKQELINVFYNLSYEDTDEPMDQRPIDGENPEPIEPERFSNTIAIMRIPEINVVAPVGYGVKESDLKKQIGMYTTTDKFLTLGGNTGFAAHTSLRGECSYCYFQHLGELKNNDTITIDYNDGNTYTFSVIEVLLEKPITADVPYNYKLSDERLITLSTCSNQGNTRDFVVAK